MSTEQGPADILGELGRREALRLARPLCPLCGARGMCSSCDPAAFQRGVELSARARRTAERYLAERARARQAGGRAA